MIPQEVIDALVSTGSVEACGKRFTDEAAVQAMHHLTQTAPEELRPSWPIVLQWARLQKAYEMAEEMGDTKGMRDAAKESKALVLDVY